MSEEPWIRLRLSMLTNGKLADLEPEACWLYVVGLLVCARDLSDGMLRAAEAEGIAGATQEASRALVEVGLWHPPGHTCKACAEPRRRFVVVHDYLRHQTSRAAIEARRETGKRAAAKRWHGSPTGGADARSQKEERHSPNQSSTDCSALSDDDVRQITALTGGGPAHARKVAALILGRTTTKVRSPLAFVLHSIGQEPNAYRFRRGNPQRYEECPDHPGEWGDACRIHAIDRKLENR